MFVVAMKTHLVVVGTEAESRWVGNTFTNVKAESHFEQPFVA